MDYYQSVPGGVERHENKPQENADPTSVIKTIRKKMAIMIIKMIIIIKIMMMMIIIIIIIHSRWYVHKVCYKREKRWR